MALAARLEAQLTRRAWPPALAGVVGALLACELGFRALGAPLGVDTERLARFRAFVRSGGELSQYEPRPHVLYVRSPIDPAVNALGFLDVEHALQKRPGTLRIACLGSSTTEGGNPAQREGSYPHFLADLLERRGQAIEVLNFGMSGWTTAETLVNYVLVVQDFEPDVVVIHEAVNDVEPRAWPGFAGDYSHYRKPWQGPSFSRAYRLLVASSDAFAAWQMSRERAFGLDAAVTRPAAGPYRFADGRLPAETAGPFRRNVRTLAELVRLRGSRPLLVTMPYDPERARASPLFRAGLDEHNRILRELAGELGVALVDLDGLVRRQPERWRPHFLDLVHLTPAGNRLKAEQIAKVVLGGG